MTRTTQKSRPPGRLFVLSPASVAVGANDSYVGVSIRAQARLKVSPAFSKAAYVQGQSPCPRSAERGNLFLLS